MPPGGGKLRRGQGFGSGEARGTGEQNAFGEAVETEGKSPCRLNRTTEKDGTEGQLSSLCLGHLAAKSRATVGTGARAV